MNRPDHIDEVDSIIASLGEAGVQFINKLKQTKTSFESFDPSDRGMAYYTPARNSFSFKPGLDLFELFNMRVHEGVHAIQTMAVPAIKTFCNGTMLELSLDDAIRLRRVQEMHAHALQAAFNAMAVDATGDRNFIVCVRPNLFLKPFVEKQLKLAGRNPALIANRIAAEYLSLPFGKGLTLGDMQDHFIMEDYERDVMAGKNPRASARLERNDIASILSCSFPLTVQNKLVEEISRPVRISSRLRPRYNDLKMTLGS